MKGVIDNARTYVCLLCLFISFRYITGRNLRSQEMEIKKIKPKFYV